MTHAPDMPEGTNYARSRTLATFTVYGETFRIVRKRWLGKPWGMYPRALCCVYGAREISGGHWTKCGEDPEAAAIYFESRLYKMHLGRDALHEALRRIGAMEPAATEAAAPSEA